MFSRVPALFFFLLANVILLANITIPHHHHDTEICIVDSHCQSDGVTHKHESDGHTHDHDGDTNSEYCVLNQVYIIPYNQVLKEYNEPENDNYYSQFEGFQSGTVAKGFYYVYPIISTVDPPLFLSNTYSRIVACGIGLRAPPIV